MRGVLYAKIVRLGHSAELFRQRNDRSASDADEYEGDVDGVEGCVGAEIDDNGTVEKS